MTTSITYQEHSVELENTNVQKQHTYIFKAQKKYDTISLNIYVRKSTEQTLKK